MTADENGYLEIEIEDSIIQLYNITQSILNRTAVIHRLRDDGGQGGFSDSNTTGYDFGFLEIILSDVRIEMLVLELSVV